MKTTLLLAPLLLALLPLVPTAAADDPCGGAALVVPLRAVSVGVFADECVGVVVAEHLFPCFQVHWGLMTDYAGVGGHHGCHAMAYVAPGELLADLLA